MPRKKAETTTENPEIVESVDDGNGIYDGYPFSENPVPESLADTSDDLGDVSAEGFDESDYGDDAEPNNDNVVEKPDAVPERPARPSMQRRQQQASAPVLTLEVGGEVVTQKDKDDAIWHEMKNSQVSGTHLTGKHPSEIRLGWI